MDHMVHVNEDHTGGGLTMGTGLSYYDFDDTEDQYEEFHETEIVGVDDLMPAVWTRCFGSSKAMGR
jgi:hypothetical protein